jgi:poly(3-hydroxybutyrate) depolymerase
MKRPSRFWVALGVLAAGLGVGLGQPVITQQPQSCTNLAGTTATFTVGATGTLPLAYQWQWGGFPEFYDRTDGTNATLVLTNVVSYQAVAYRVIVTNVEGAVTSGVAQLTIVLPPVITLQPKDQVVPEGTNAGFGVSVSGTAPFSYQWRWEGTEVPNATNASLSFSHAALANAGAYSVFLSNVGGAVTSRLAQLSVAEGSVFTDTQGTQLPYRLFHPPKYNPGIKYPLVLFWHGAGEVGVDNLGQLRDNGEYSFLTASNQAKFPCFYLLPQVGGSFNEYQILDWATNLLSYLEEQFNIDPDRFYVTGLSMGGFSTWAMIARYPDRVAAAIPMSGGIVYNNLTDYLQSLHVPIWNFHAADDGSVPVAYSDESVASLRGLGASINYTRYQTGGHGIWSVAYSTPGLVDWLMAQRRGVDSTTEPLLTITSPTLEPLLPTGATNLNFAGTAGAMGQAVGGITWQNQANGRTGMGSGTKAWSATGLPLVANQTNLIIVTARTISWWPAYGGYTTFNDTLTVIQTPLRATVARQGTRTLLNWNGGGPPYGVQRASNLAVADWTDVLTNVTPPVELPQPLAGQAGFYRIVGQ